MKIWTPGEPGIFRRFRTSLSSFFRLLILVSMHAHTAELRETCGKINGSDDYIIQLRSHLPKKKPIPFNLLKTFWEKHKVSAC